MVKYSLIYNFMMIGIWEAGKEALSLREYIMNVFRSEWSRTATFVMDLL